jgi:peptidoglycan lytic transglycosylase
MNTAQAFLFRFIRRNFGAIALVAFACLLLAGCGGHKQARVNVPSPPPIAPAPPQKQTPPAEAQAPKTTPAPPAAEEETEEETEALSVPPDAKPLLVETGLASWYGPPYHNRRSSNGEVYNMNAFTAAHRTLPLGSIVRVTNIKTGNSVIVRITDRGPFIDGRILDLSLAAAKKIDLWRAGVAPVRMEVLKTPLPMETGGRWAVQIGGFNQEEAATEIADHLSHRYRSAKVLCFNSPVGDWWVRVRVKDDDRKRAEEVAHDAQTSQGAIFLVRLD